MTKCPYCGQPATLRERGGLTIRQAGLLDWLLRWDWSLHKSPSYDEILQGTGYKSKSQIYHLLHGLAERGFVDIKKNRRRGITLITPSKG